MIRKLLEKIRKCFAGYLAKKPVNRWPIVLRARWAMKQYNKLEGHTFDLAHPELFTEKIVWYRLFYRHPDMTRMYDKYLFKDYIAEKLGPGFTAPLYGMWTDVRDLERDWDGLPDAFCLKSNCSSLGKNIIFVRNKEGMDKTALLQETRRWLDPMNTGINSCNGAYRRVKPRIMAEKILSARGEQLYDYKVLCFGGKPDHIMATADRFPLERGALSYSFYDLEWNKLPITTPGYQNADIPRPHDLSTMLSLAEKLSRGFPFVRVDFYDTADGVVIGEMTLYPSPNYDQKGWDRTLGEKFTLPRSKVAEMLRLLRGIKRRLRRLFQRPISRWPIEKRVDMATRNYAQMYGHTFDLAHPMLFTEKRVWYLLFYEHPDMTRIYDKYLFKSYIEEKLGPGWTAPLYGMWTDMRSFKRDWDSLPDTFVLKSNCSSLGKNVVFVRDKKSVDKEALFRKVKTWLDPMNTAINSCNRAYYGVTPRIMAEKLLTAKGDQLYDYKVMCFGGKADHILATADRFPLEEDNLVYTFYDLAWNKLPVTARGHENRDVPPPEHLKEMVEVAEKLSQGFPHVRVDFYDTVDGLRIGEMTFYNTTVYEQPQWDLRLGELFVLPDTERK